jgi:hypothetical protein
VEENRLVGSRIIENIEFGGTPAMTQPKNPDFGPLSVAEFLAAWDSAQHGFPTVLGDWLEFAREEQPELVTEQNLAACLLTREGLHPIYAKALARAILYEHQMDAGE